MGASSQSLSNSILSRFSRTRSFLLLPQKPQLSLPRPPNLKPRLVHLPLISRGSSNFRVQAAMVEVKSRKGLENLNILDSEEELSISLAKYTAKLSGKFAKERGAFTVVVSVFGFVSMFDLILMGCRKIGNCWSPHLWIQLISQDDMFSGLMRELFLRITQIVTISLLMTTSCLRTYGKQDIGSKYYSSFGLCFCTLRVVVKYNLLEVPIPLGHVYAINDALSAKGAAHHYETCLKQLVKTNVIATSTSGFPKFDLMLLGMGPDGQVASLFPGHPLVNEDKKWVTFIKDSPKPPPERITFMFPVINSSSYIALVVCGGGKAGAVKTALGGNQTSDLLPVQMVSPEGELKWFLDKEATSKL
ncbi:hypothetical protein Cgig2_019339 [Carnegiea gigantea]|uniref:Glucosamine/galactosamine-6-phosphate isomerase domain-containing protein n=1 Tax=Carnegiea gigantea TaxID=171969 RepID=A0A9Q1QLZ1_9CARY|nr:hypothetical protein Cgig2_019339 [Carnegiea gigantea]